MEQDFKTLVKQARKGDRTSFAALYSQVYTEMYRYACFTLRSTHDAEDAVADAVLDAYSTIGRLRDPQAFKIWIFRILSSKCKRKLREYYKHEQSISEDIIGLGFEENQASDEKADLYKAMEILEEDERMIISLRVLMGYNSVEISKILKMNSNTVRSKYTRSLEKVKTEMLVELSWSHEKNYG